MKQKETDLIVDHLKNTYSELVAGVIVERGDIVVACERGQARRFLEHCKEDAELDFNMLVDVTAVDWMDNRPERFEVVYQLLSVSKKRRLTVSIAVAEERPEVDSVVSLWQGASFMEREVWDMFGISFSGHPDLRRVLMYEEFVGHPLRKDYPIQGKQPRVPLRYPEVENTARQMIRPELVTIRTRKSNASGSSAGTL